MNVAVFFLWVCVAFSIQCDNQRVQNYNFLRFVVYLLK